MTGSIEVLFAPVEFSTLSERDLSGTVCVVFDVLRATSSIITALANGANSVVPVEEIHEALALRKKDPQMLLAGERDGVLITSAITGSIDFDLGNSPREFQPQRVRGRSIAMTTTNGTRALRACRSARETLACSFLNITATAKRIESIQPSHLLIVCSGTFEEAAYEDVLGAGALLHRLFSADIPAHAADSARMALNLYISAGANLVGALGKSRNGNRLLARPELAQDVNYCAQLDVFELAAALGKDGSVRAL